ncbi:hypothetical protein M422DRAFT_250296 [Sphaerobolus stellatus SS14]|uniref:Uncharacterized protein n=1 Tax=Sphaerobolus stellatus (strain SS14) TaxID=990650 RepID=A0A0C9W3A9_SPHS4|nr:hypothetical protein M422DRAFT_250296 [Sphaerobolus stellatus SS14]
MAEEHNHSHSGPMPPTQAGPRPTRSRPRLGCTGRTNPTLVAGDPNTQNDFSVLNSLAHQLNTMLLRCMKAFHLQLTLRLMQNPRSVTITKAKDEGNKLYSQQKYSEAIVMYTAAAQITITRPITWLRTITAVRILLFRLELLRMNR